ncbi:helix-turn-helix domain-containing protein [Paenibacillus sp. RS8]|uniref:helix-turn-helix domain-containing protein n=1 Tax=Paenibacillus sp. RS8 TaxID=3242681 RepID=UPI0035C132E5
MELVPVRCRIPELLVRIDKKQQWLADKLGISKQQMSDIINMRYEDMTLKRAAMIAYHLDCQIEDLHEWELR